MVAPPCQEEVCLRLMKEIQEGIGQAYKECARDVLLLNALNHILQRCCNIKGTFPRDMG